MTRPLTGLSGLAGYQVTIEEDSQAGPEDRMGSFADPRHGQPSPEQYIRRGAQLGTPHGPYGPENQMLGDESWFWQPGGEEYQDPNYDYTPSKRAGPFPKGIASGPTPSAGPDDIANQLNQSAFIHGIDTNADAGHSYSREFALNDEWQTIDQTTPGHTDLRPLDKQALSSGYQWGTRDVVQSMARQNEFGFDSAHQYRRWAAGPIPGNTMWMRPGGRPMAKSLPGPARPAIGVDSPFAGDDLGASFDIHGAVLQNVPSEYVAPPQPALSQAVVTPDYGDSVVEWY
jgi:hypothetical protein